MSRGLLRTCYHDNDNDDDDDDDYYYYYYYYECRTLQRDLRIHNRHINCTYVRMLFSSKTYQQNQ